MVIRIKEYYEELYSNEEKREFMKEEDWNIEAWDTNEEILIGEAEAAIKNSKEGKAVGTDGITMEMIKAGGITIAKTLCNLYNTCLKLAIFPDEWCTAKLIILYKKKGDRRDLKNYRPLSLLSVLYKLFSKIILNRISSTLDLDLTEHQAGFKRNFSTTDHIFVINQIIIIKKKYMTFLCAYYL